LGGILFTHQEIAMIYPSRSENHQPTPHASFISYPSLDS
jgi:hypothetical protein